MICTSHPCREVDDDKILDKDDGKLEHANLFGKHLDDPTKGAPAYRGEDGGAGKVP